jgi:hypothetical protein
LLGWDVTVSGSESWPVECLGVSIIEPFGSAATELVFIGFQIGILCWQYKQKIFSYKASYTGYVARMQSKQNRFMSCIGIAYIQG